MQILLTRPERQSIRFAGEVSTRMGTRADVVISPILEIEAVKDTFEIDENTQLIFTSENAVWAACEHLSLHGKSAWCVGQRAAQAVGSAGATTLATCETAADLSTKIMASRPKANLAHIRGEHLAFEMAKSLQSAGLTIKEHIVYRQTHKRLTPQAQELLLGDKPVFVPLFSVRSAKLFFRSAVITAPLNVVAISAAVAKCVPNDQVTQCDVAEKPNGMSVIDILNRIY